MADLMVNILSNSLNNADDIKEIQKAIKSIPKDTLMTIEEMTLMNSVEAALKQCKAATTRTVGALDDIFPKYIEMGYLKPNFKQALEAGESPLVESPEKLNQPCQPEKKRVKFNPHDPSQQTVPQNDPPVTMTQDPNEMLELVSYEDCMNLLEGAREIPEYVPTPVVPEQQMMTQVRATPPQQPGYWRPPPQKRPHVSKAKNVNVKK